MSYCVNCGVELDKALRSCPLCQTKIYHPGHMETVVQETFPEKRGEVEKESNREVVILFSVIVLAVMITCGLLNKLVYDMSKWSVPVISICIMLWTVFMGAVLKKKITIYGMLLLDAASVLLGVYLLTFISEKDQWYMGMGLPIVCAILVILEMFALLAKILPYNMLVGTLYFFIAIAGICSSIEGIIDFYYTDEVHLSWSAIVLTVCTIISVALIAIMMMSRLRNTIRKRLHF